MDDRLSKKLYNPEFKKLFIDRYDNQNTKETIENVLANATLSEEVLGKDLYDFTLDEIGEVIKASNPLNAYSAYNIGRHIYRYILFAKNVRKSNIHPMDGIDPDWYKRLVGKNKKYIFSKSEIENIITQLENEQDKAMIALLFEGAHGQENSELRNLRKQDVDQFRREITVHDNKDHSARVIQLSEWCMDIVNKAINSLHYRRLSRVQKSIIVPVVDNDYVFRPLQMGRNKSDNAPITYQVFYTRLKRVSEQFDLPYLTASGIQQSGMIYMAYRLFMRDGVLESKQLNEIAKKYNVGNYIYGSGREPYLNTTLFRKRIDRDTILKLYHVDVNA